MPKLTDQNQLYIRSMGKLLRVTALFSSDTEVGDYGARHPDEIVVGEFTGLIFLADAYDKGSLS